MLDGFLEESSLARRSVSISILSALEKSFYGCNFSYIKFKSCLEMDGFKLSSEGKLQPCNFELGNQR